MGAIQTSEHRTYDLTVEGDVLLSNDASTDSTLLAALLRKVTRDADWLERELLAGRDDELKVFRKELEGEGRHE